jgi:hypothetical protein
MSEREDRKLGWRLGQGILGMLTSITNASAARNERLIETPAQGEQIVVIGGRRWRIWYDAAGERNATPLSED